MSDESQSLSPDFNQPGTSKIIIPKPSGSSSGLTLVLPSLKHLKAAKGGKKSKQRFGSYPRIQDGEPQEKKAPRPVKLKPLKEVLSKLIFQIKKKDDYAFFLVPVDASQTPGYSDLVNNPMDLGTMTEKVNRGKYRSLDDFASDFRLVTMNAKIYNAPGTIYHTEAERLEVWGLDHIAKASPTVIQYETNWNIDIEKDDDSQTVNVDDDDDNPATPDERGRSQSVASQPHPGPSRRGPRGPYKKHTNSNANTVTESIDAEGRLPGSKDGVGAFPPGSDWAKTMVALKLKGKRYRTKRERLRIEKDGPPYLPDGSLDYNEMEDPFSVLSAFVPDPLSRPRLVPLYPPLSATTSQPQQGPSDSASPQPQPFQTSEPYPSIINVSLNHTLPTVPSQPLHPTPSKRRHWAISRGVIGRTKGKDREDDLEFTDEPSWQVPREPHAIDFGSFAELAAELMVEMRRRGITSGSAQEGEEQSIIFDLLRESLDCEEPSNNGPTEVSAQSGAVNGHANGHVNDHNPPPNHYWTTQRATEAEEYIRDIVYGGVDGLAYVRSLAEFVSFDKEFTLPGTHQYHRDLGLPLAQWVLQNIVDPLTEERHSLIRQSALHLGLHLPKKSEEIRFDHQSVADQVAASLNIYPSATVALAALLQIRLHKIDMGALIKTPEELFQSEEEWAGRDIKEKRRKVKKKKSETFAESDAMEVEEPERTWMEVDASVSNGKMDMNDSDYELEGPEELNEVLDHVAGVITELDLRIRERESTEKRHTNGIADDETQASNHTEEGIPDKEDPVLRNLRFNLLALAKRAPLDTIARLPKDLVPEHIRHFVPTLGTS